MATRSVLQRDDAAVRRNYANRLKAEADSEKAGSGRTSIGAGRDSVVKINTSSVPDILKNPKTETRTSGDVSYDLSVLSDRRNDLIEELSKLNNGTGRYTDEGKSRISEIESELKSIRSQEKRLDAELESIKETAVQALIDSGEYRRANLYDLTVNSFNQGRYSAKYGQESYKDMTGAENEKETYAEILAGEDYKYIPQSSFGEMISNAAGMLGQTFQQLNDKRTLNAGIAGAATGAGMALAAGQAGPQIAAPEEVVTVPVAAMTGFATGINAGSAAVNFEIEAGLAYNEMVANGVSEKTARAIALGVGGVNAALEAIQLDELTDAFKITKRMGTTENFAKELAKEIVKRTGGVLKESVQEVAQEGVTIGGTQLGSKLDTGKWAYNSRDVVDRLNDTAKSSVFSFGLLNLPANVTAMQHQLADMQFRQRMDDLAAVYEKNVGEYAYKGELSKSVQQEQVVAESALSNYNNLIEKHIQVDSASLLQTAKDGGKHKGIYVDALKKDQRKLEKSIASHTAQVEEHAAKIVNPSLYDIGWNEKDQRAKEGLLRKWEKDMKRNAEQASIEIAMWKERYGNE